MTDIRFIINSIILTFCSLTGYSQTLKTIDSLEAQYQNCLDKGQNMIGCSRTFYNQMDSLLNVRYKKLRLLCDSVQRANIRDEQLEWLSKRDNHFLQNQRQANKEAKKVGNEIGQDELMILIDANANYVKQRVVELINSSPKDYSADNYKVSPTGFYSLDNKTETKNGDTYGYFGDIKVKSIASNRIVVRLFVCKGAPSYNSGTLADTLTISQNKAIYKNAEFDSSCRITFTFYKQGIKVEEITDDYNFGCGFGHAVIADGFYKRKSNKIPTDKELAEE